MKKILLTCSVLLGLLSAKAQLGTDFAHDDFQLDVPYGNNQGGVFWFNDSSLYVGDEPSTVFLTRTGGGTATLTMEEEVYRMDTLAKTKIWDEGKNEANPTNGVYVFGVSWGDSNGEADGGEPFTIDISNSKTMTLVVENTFETQVNIDIQLQDINGIKLEIMSDTADGKWDEKMKFHCLLPAGETTTCTVDFTGGFTLDYENAPLDDYDGAANPWPCGNVAGWPAESGCPLIKDNSSFDFTQLTQVILIPNGQCVSQYAPAVCAFGDNVKIHEFSIGNVPAKTAAPTGVTATATDDTHINIDWADLADFDSVRVARSMDPLSGFEFIYAADTEEKSDMGDGYNAENPLSPNTTYYYYVIADNGLYSYSEIVSATTLPPADAPAAPSDFTVVETGEGIVLNWKNNAENATEFVVSKKLKTETNFTELKVITITGADTDTSFTDAFGNYVIGKEYDYSVVARNTGGSSASVTGSVQAVGFGDDIVKLSATIYPNPATSEVKFSEELKDVVIYNAHGVVMYSASKASKVNVSEFSKGLYYLQTAKGSKTFIVE